MVEIVINDTGDRLDIVDDSINYVRQVSDIADFSVVNASYSWSFKIPRTSTNEVIFDALGFIGSQSRKPYESIGITLLYRSAVIVGNGKLIITETTDTEYKAHIKDGAVSLYDAIGSDTMLDLNLTDTSHIKTVQSISDTFNSGKQDYKYLIAWFGYPLLADEDDTSNTSDNGLLPFLNFRYILDKIEDKYGWEFIGLDDFLNKTYISTKANEEGGEPYTAGIFNFENILNFNTYYPVVLDSEFINNDILNHDTSYSIRIEDAGTYTIKAGGKFWLELLDGTVIYPSIRMYINGDYVSQFSYPREVSVVRDLPFGSLIEFRIIPTQEWEGEAVTFHIDTGFARVVRENTEFVDFSELMGNLKVSDILKEIFIRNASTLYFDNENKTVTAQSAYSRVNASDEDLSQYYVRLISEKYVSAGYAQRNLLSHKYNEEGDNYDDGVIHIDDENIKPEEVLYESFGYTREERNVILLSDDEPVSTLYLKSFEIENSEDPDKIKYKPLKDRYFIAEFDYNQTRRLGINNQVFTGLPLANMDRTAYRNVVAKWAPFDKILNDAKIHNIEFRMHPSIFSSIDLSKVVYIDEQKSFYIINKLSLKKDKTVEAELIKINNYNPIAFQLQQI